MKILYRVGAVLFLAIMVLGMAMLFTPFIFDTVWLRLLGLIPMVIGFIGGVFCLGQTEDELKSKREKLYKKLEDDDVFSVVEGTLFLRKQCSELKKIYFLETLCDGAYLLYAGILYIYVCFRKRYDLWYTPEKFGILWYEREINE